MNVNIKIADRLIKSQLAMSSTPVSCYTYKVKCYIFRLFISKLSRKDMKKILVTFAFKIPGFIFYKVSSTINNRYENRKKLILLISEKINKINTLEINRLKIESERIIHDDLILLYDDSPLIIGKVFDNSTMEIDQIKQAISSARILFQVKFLLAKDQRELSDFICNKEYSNIVQKIQADIKKRDERIKRGNEIANSTRHNSSEYVINKIFKIENELDIALLKNHLNEIKEIAEIDRRIMEGMKYRYEFFGVEIICEQYLKDKLGFYTNSK